MHSLGARIGESGEFPREDIEGDFFASFSVLSEDLGSKTILIGGFLENA